MTNENSDYILAITGEIVTAYVSNNQLAPHELTMLVSRVYDELQQKAQGAVSVGSNLARHASEASEGPQKPAVSIKKSVTDEYIVCLEDGAKLKMLKKHLRVHFNMTPQEYRAKWGLPKDYPMVAPNYARLRAEQARRIGLGRKPGAVAPARRGRSKTAA